MEGFIYNYRAIDCTVMSLRYSICWLISNITAIITTSQRIISLKAPSRSLTSNWYMNSLNIQWGDSLTTCLTLTIFQGSLLHFQSDDRIQSSHTGPFRMTWDFPLSFSPSFSPSYCTFFIQQACSHLWSTRSTFLGELLFIPLQPELFLCQIRYFLL